MTRGSLIFICAFVILTQLVANSNEEDIDWTTAHEELRKLGAGFRKKCISETGVTNELLDGAESGNFPTNDNKLSCYFKCMMEKGGVMKKDGTINDKILVKLTPQAYRSIQKEMLDQCRDIEDTDKCNKALKFNQCMYNANPVAYFVV